MVLCVHVVCVYMCVCVCVEKDSLAGLQLI